MKADRSINPERRAAALKFLDGEADAAPMPRLLVSQVEAARALGVSRATVRRLVLSGRLEPVTLLKSRRYRLNDLRELAR